jgi:hypothetical protein
LVAIPTAIPPPPYLRLRSLGVVVRLKIDGVFVDIGQQKIGHFGQTGFSISHRCRGIGIHRTEIALTIDQREAHRPVLGHARQRIIDRRIAVRMVITHHVANDFGRLAIRAARDEATFLRRPQNATVDRLKAVANVRQRTRDDDRHCVVEIPRLHFVDDVDRRNIRRVG